MFTTIVFAHPWHGSFNKAILDQVTNALKSRGKDHMVIDLYKEGFDPVLEAIDLATYEEGKTSDYHVADYIEIMKDTDEIVYIFPVWWYDAPAILKGFFDKVLLKHFAYEVTEEGLVPALNIEKTTLITTSDVPTEVLIEEFGDPITKVIIDGTLRVTGMTGGKWYNLGNVKGVSQEERTAFLDKVRNLFT